MRHKIIALLLGFGVAGSATFAQEPAPPSNIKLIALGQIAKVDKAKRSFDLRSVRETAQQRTERGGDDIRIGINIGRGIPDATVPGGPRRPEPGRFPGNPPIPDEPDRRFPESITTKVFLTDTTVCKADDKVLLCDDLKISDSVRVTGDERLSDPRGKGLYATEVLRTRSPNR